MQGRGHGGPSSSAGHTLARVLTCLLGSRRGQSSLFPAHSCSSPWALMPGVGNICPHPPPLQTAPGLGSAHLGHAGIEKGGRLVQSPETMGRPIKREERAKLNPIMIFRSLQKRPTDTEMALLFCSREGLFNCHQHRVPTRCHVLARQPRPRTRTPVEALGGPSVGCKEETPETRLSPSGGGAPCRS